MQQKVPQKVPQQVPQKVPQKALTSRNQAYLWPGRGGQMGGEGGVQIGGVAGRWGGGGFLWDSLGPSFWQFLLHSGVWPVPAWRSNSRLSRHNEGNPQARCVKNTSATGGLGPLAGCLQHRLHVKQLFDSRKHRTRHICDGASPIENPLRAFVVARPLCVEELLPLRPQPDVHVVVRLPHPFTSQLARCETRRNPWRRCGP